jgi:hypothetical protein
LDRTTRLRPRSAKNPEPNFTRQGEVFLEYEQLPGITQK